MKRSFLPALLVVISFSFSKVFSQVGIGTASPNQKAVLELKSPGNNQGFLVPRLTTAERTGITGLSSSEKGLLVFDSDTNKFFYWSGSAWVVIDDSVGADSQTLTFNSSTGLLSISGGNNVTVGGVIPGGAAGGDLTGTYPNPTVSNDAITAAKLQSDATTDANRAVTTNHIRDNAVVSAKILDGTIVTGDLADGAVTDVKIASGIAPSKLSPSGTNFQVLTTVAGATTWSDLPPGTGSVTNVATGAGLTGGPITTTGTISLADNGVTTVKVADGAITTAKITDGTIANADVSATAGVLVSKLAAGTNGQVLLTSGTTPTWSSMPPPTGTAGGDLSGTYPNPTINNDAIVSLKILDGTIATVDILNGAITTAKIADAAVNALKILDGAVTTSKILDGAVSGIKIATDAVTSAHILDGTLATVDLANGAISGIKIAADAVTSAKILDGTLATADLADGAITSLKVLDGALATADLADGAITSLKVLDGALATADLANGAVTSAKVLDGDLATADLADGAITSLKVLDGALATADLANGAVTSAKVLDGDLATADLADGAITSLKVLDGALATADLANGAVTSAKVLDGDLVNADISASASIATSKFAAGTAGQVLITLGTTPTWSGIGGDLSGTFPNPTIATGAGNNLVAAINNVATTGTINTAKLNTSVVLDTETPAAGDVSGSFNGGIQINANAVSTSEILDGTIGTADIAAAAITDAKIASGIDVAKLTASPTTGFVLTTVLGNVTWAALPVFGLGTVTNVATGTGLTGGPITTTGTISIASNGVTSTELQSDAVVNTNRAVTSNHIRDNAIVSSKITDGTIATADLADASITSLKIADGTIASADILDGTVSSTDILDGTVSSTDILDGTVSSTDILDGTVSTTDILDGSIANADISASAAVAVSKLAPGTIGDVLTTVAAGPTWQAPADNSATNELQKLSEVLTQGNNAGAASAVNFSALSVNRADAPGALNVNGSQYVSFNALGTVASYTVGANDYVIIGTATPGVITNVTLPSAGANIGRVLILKGRSIGSASAAGLQPVLSGTDTLDGVANPPILTPVGTSPTTITIISIGAGEWVSINRTHN